MLPEFGTGKFPAAIQLENRWLQNTKEHLGLCCSAPSECLGQGPAAELAPGSTPANGVRPPKWGKAGTGGLGQKPALWGWMRDGSVPIIPTTHGSHVSFVGFWPGKGLSLLHSPSPPTTFLQAPRTSNRDSGGTWLSLPLGPFEPSVKWPPGQPCLSFLTQRPLPAQVPSPTAGSSPLPLYPKGGCSESDRWFT